MLGATEVIFSGFEKKNPDLIVAHSEDSVLLIKWVDNDMALSLLGDYDKEKKLKKDIEEMVSKIDNLKEAYKIRGL